MTTVILKGKTGLALPRLGQLWPEQGGVYAGVVRGEYGAQDHHLIVPAGAAAFNRAVAWGGYGEDEPGARHVLDGLANTRALVQSKHGHPAAQWATGIQLADHSDFYLPSRGELRLCWINVPELFEDGWYWSSTQYSRLTAWGQTFGGGYQDLGDKKYEARARAVRRLIP